MSSLGPYCLPYVLDRVLQKLPAPNSYQHRKKHQLPRRAQPEDRKGRLCPCPEVFLSRAPWEGALGPRMSCLMGPALLICGLGVTESHSVV